MKRIRITPSLVWAAKDQDPDGIEIVRRGGATSAALNLTARTEGVVESTHDSEAAAYCSREPSITDCRDGATLLLSVSEEGELRLEGRIDPREGWTPIEQVIGSVPEPVASYTSAGEFLILVLKSGALYFLLWHADLHSYTSPGLFPEMPQISVHEISEVEISADVASIKFESATDLRSGVPKSIAEEAEKRVREAWVSLRDHAAQSGRWIQPVLVRGVVRLWNGSCLYVGDPILVGGSGWQGTSRVSLPLAGTSGGYTGTIAGQIAARSFEIEAEVKSFPQGHWADIIRSVEFWVSEEVDPVSPASASAGYVAGSAYIHVSLPCEDEEVLWTSLINAPLQKCSALSASDTILLRRGGASDSARLRGVDNSLSLIRVKTALGHAGFLHLGGIRRADPLPRCPLASGTQTLSWRAEVKLGDAGNLRSVTAWGVAHGAAPELAPFFWYPDGSARSLTISVCDEQGQWYEKEFPLSGAPSSESAAMICNARFQSEALEKVDAPGVVPAARGFIDHGATLITMSRGNPFVAVSSTSSVGGDISVLAPQIMGGGAFTRQYIYCFTDKGIMALNHDKDGKHTNCRQISKMQISGERLVIATDEGLFALTVNGCLLRIRDSKILVLMRGLGYWHEIGWESSSSLLWLLPESNNYPARVIGVASDKIAASTRWPVPARLLLRSCPMLFGSSGDSTVIHTPESMSSSPVMARWESSPIFSDLSGIVQFSVYWPKPPEDVEIEIWYEDREGHRSRVYALHSDSSAPETQQAYFMLPMSCALPNLPRGSLIITVVGYFTALGMMELEEVKMPSRRS